MNSQDAANVAHEEQIAALASKARSAGEWVDIYTEVVEYNVKTTMEANGDGLRALEVLKERRPLVRYIRTAFEEHGLSLSEDIEIEGGPVVETAVTGLPTKILWPSGEWIRFHWPDGSKLEFRGAKAWTAYTFIRWWESYQQRFKQLTDPTSVKPKTRLIEPHSPEWQRYMDAKRKDQGHS